MVHIGVLSGFAVAKAVVEMIEHHFIFKILFSDNLYNIGVSGLWRCDLQISAAIHVKFVNEMATTDCVTDHSHKHAHHIVK